MINKSPYIPAEAGDWPVAAVALLPALNGKHFITKDFVPKTSTTENKSKNEQTNNRPVLLGMLQKCSSEQIDWIIIEAQQINAKLKQIYMIVCGGN